MEKGKGRGYNTLKSQYKLSQRKIAAILGIDQSIVERSKYIGTRGQAEEPPVGDSLQNVFDQGHDVGEWAKKVFPGGKH